MQKRLLARTRAVYIWLMAPLLGLSVVLAVFISLAAPVQAATTSSNLNFQARLLTSSGAVVPDGNYNIDFKLYTADSTTGSVGTCAGACVWEETRTNAGGHGVPVINGYFSVNLGSVTAFGGSINWDQQLWLTMNIGGVSTGAVTWDGEMQNAGHSIALTALPYAFTAGQLAATSGANRGSLSFGSVTNNPVITLPNASGTVCLNSSSACGFISGSGTAFIQNGNTLGATAVFGTLDGNGINIITNNHVVQSLSSTGAATFENFSNSALAFQVQDSSASSYLSVNTTDGFVINNGTKALGNDIENPGFESTGSTDATGWYTPGAGQAITTDAANAHSGNHELQVTGNSSTHAITTKYFAVHPGDTIYTEAYVKNSAGATGDGGIYVEFSDKDKGNATFTSADTGLPGTSYVLKSIQATVPAGKTFVRVAVSVKATATAGTFYFDDFYLKLGNQQAPLLINNASATAFQVQNASAQTILGVDATTSKIFTTIPNGASAVGFTLNTPSYTTAGAKLLSLQNNAAEKFSVDKDGNIVNTGGLAATGDITTSGGNISAGAGKQYQINGTQVTSAILSNDNNLAKLTGTGPQIFSGNNKFTGTVLAANTNAAGFQVQNATTNVFTVDTSGNKTILGTGGAGGLTGNLQFNFSGSSGSISLVALDPSSSAFTLSLPAETGTLCTSAATSTGNCTNFASASGVASSLATKLNKGLADTSSHAVTALEGDLYAFSNTSSGVASGVLKLDNANNTDNALLVTGSTDYASGKAYILVNNTNATPTGSLIDLQANASSVFKVDAAGNTTLSGNISIGTGKFYEINGTQITTAALSDNNTIAKLAANQTFSGNNTFSSASNSFTGDGSGLTNLNATNVASGTLNDGRLSANVALLNRSGQIFGGDNTFAPTAPNVGTTITQTSGTATSGSVLDVQAFGGAHFLQITNAASGEGNVTLQSVGATRQLTLNSSNGTILLGTATTGLQKQGASLDLDIASVSNSTLNIKNTFGGTASINLTGGVNIATGQTYKINGSQISSSALSNDVDLAKLASANTFTNTNIVKVNSTAAFQVQNATSSAAVMVVDTTNKQLKVFDGSGGTHFALIYYDSGSSTANYTADSGTVAVGAGAGAITVTAGTGSAVNITANASSSWKTNTGTLTLQSGSGSSDFLILNSGGSNQIQVSGTSILKFGSTTADPTCVNGAIYYNTTTPQFRGCVNGTWQNLASITPTLQTTYNSSTGSTTPEVKLNAGGADTGGFDIQDADTSIAGVLFAVRKTNNAGLGTSMFNVDTSNNSVNVGSNSGHSTNPIILVLDNYANSGADPTTTINGSMYYNGTKNKFRCYENGAWVDCINGPSESVTTLPYNNWGTGVGTKAATGTMYVIPVYVPGQMTVNEMRINVTVTLGAAGDIGLYDSNGNLVVNGGTGSLTTATGLKTITPTQSNKTIEAGQYYAVVTWNSTTGQVGGITGLTAGQLKHVGTLTTGGSVLPSTITISSISNTSPVIPGMTFNN